MLFSFSPSAHQRACAWKQKERQSQLDALPSSFSQPLTLAEEKVHALSVSQIVSQCRTGALAPAEVMKTYAKKALKAQEATNCLTDVMFQESLITPAIAGWGPGVDSMDGNITNDMARDGLLLGVPVSIKDTVDIEGHDTTIGYSRHVGKPVTSSSSIVQLLRHEGAIIHAKTTAPTGLFNIETESDVYGRTSNPYNSSFTPGASSGGGAALIACGGTKVEIGSDIGGSVRVPAHFCGIWSLKGSSGRFPSWGNASSLPGLEGIPLITAPMAGNLDDLEEFYRRVVLAEPWRYDHTCIPLPWRPINLQEEGRKLKWGVLWDDGAISPTPACRRALATVVTALRKQGHEVTDFTPPDVSSGLQTGYEILFQDGGIQAASFLQPGERLGAAAQSIVDLFRLPRIVKKLLAFFSSDPFTADSYESMHPKTILENRAAIVARDEYRARWHKKWIDEGLDFVISVPHPLPAFEHGGAAKATLHSVGMTFVFNMLDYTAGVLPVTHVDKDVDGLPPNFTTSSEYSKMNSVAKGVYSVYEPEKMHGLPLGVQVVGRRLQEEKVLQGMRVVESALNDMGLQFRRRTLG
ncbi:amidase signature domain-containing protein [Coprinopsis sp. MPI-PUGE-AT-0042]|nr:amidase signature domain-containing protein [Coprinopsis sp. MPI-PUGE-AT-0042]